MPASIRDGLDGTHHVLEPVGLLEVALHADRAALDDGPEIAPAGDRQDADAPMGPLETTGRLEPAHAGEAQVEHHDVGFEAARLDERALSIGCFTDDDDPLGPFACQADD